MRLSIFLLLTLLLLSGCSFGKEQAPDLHGYVLEEKDSQIIVVSKTANDYSAQGGVKQFYDAILLDRVPEHVEVGQEVKVWYKGEIEESYPACGSIKHIEVVENEQPSEASLHPQEVVQQALEKINIEYMVAITDVLYNEETESWTVTYRPISLFNDDKERLQTIHIPDP